jgi:hypothetical protein
MHPIIARIPFVRRPFFQRDSALRERDRAMTERDRARAELQALRTATPMPPVVTGGLHAFAVQSYSADVGTKPPVYYQRYDQAFAARNFRPTTMLEVGVHMGESTKVFSSVFPEATIVGIDIKKNDIDFSGFPQITYLEADQTKPDVLNRIMDEHFPNGIDLVIDDASHIGSFTKITFDTVFPRVRRGGLYIVEDWGTGYWDDFPDGGRYQEYPLNFFDGHPPKRLPSHDYGMVGFIKSLVDYTGEGDMRVTQAAPRLHQNRIHILEVSPGICIAEKTS